MTAHDARWCQTPGVTGTSRDEELVDLDRDSLLACAELYVETFNAAPWHDAWTIGAATERLEEILETPGFVGVALIADGVVTGAALGQIERWFSGRHFYLREMFVHADLQRGGRGTRLLGGLADRCIDVEASYLITDRGTAAEQFYDRHGFSLARSRIVMTRRQ